MSDSDSRADINPNKNYSKTALINAYTLGAFAVIAALVLGSIYVATKDRIDASRLLAEQKALLEVIGDYPHENELLNDRLELTSDELELLNTSDSAQIYVIRHQGKTTGFIFPAVAPDGYSGDISMLIGISSNSEVLGVRVVDHRETPGLGDKIDIKKSDWILGFAGTSLSNPSIENWAVTKDGGTFDAFTGATITPRAMVNRVRSVLEYFQSNQVGLIDRAEKSVSQGLEGANAG